MAKLRLQIVKAKSIEAADSNGFSDPYVKFRWKGEKLKTSIKIKTLSPKWHEIFVIPWDGTDTELEFELWDANAFSRNRKMATLNLKLDKDKMPIEQYFPFTEGQGEIYLKIEHKESTGSNQRNYYAHNYDYSQPYQPTAPPTPAFAMPPPAAPLIGGTDAPFSSRKPPFTASIEDILRYSNRPINASQSPCLPVNNAVDFTDQIPVRVADRFKALIIGINYTGIRGAELKGCVLDAERMKYLLVTRFGFIDSPQTMMLMTDNETGYNKPTRHNIMMALQWLVAEAQPGDSLVFHFSGHGAQIADTTGNEKDGLDETILPIDFKQSGQIVDNDLFRNIVYPLPSGVKLTCIMDCCHSGTGMDLSFEYDPNYKSWRDDDAAFHPPCNAVLIAGCADDDVSADCKVRHLAGGALTSALYTQLMETQVPFTFSSLMLAVRNDLSKRKVRQKAQLSSSQRFHPEMPFNLTEILGNTNPRLGRFSKHPRRRPPKQGMQLRGGEMLLGLTGGMALGILGGLMLD